MVVLSQFEGRWSAALRPAKTRHESSIKSFYQMQQSLSHALLGIKQSSIKADSSIDTGSSTYWHAEGLALEICPTVCHLTQTGFGLKERAAIKWSRLYLCDQLCSLIVAFKPLDNCFAVQMINNQCNFHMHQPGGIQVSLRDLHSTMGRTSVSIT